MENLKLDTIEEAIAAIAQGQVVVVVDDEDRENEGDLVCAADCVTPELINFMLSARGMLCCSLTEQRCEQLGLDLMVGNNTDLHQTAFTVTVDLKGQGVTTGISATDRAKTLKALVNGQTRPEDLRRPGHISPLKAVNGGVLRRAGHTEASVDLAQLAGHSPAGVIIEVLNEHGEPARLPELRQFADRHGLKLVSIKDLIAYRLRTESLIEREERVLMPTAYGDFDLVAYKQLTTGAIHLALVKGEWRPDEAVLVRMHSSCVTGDIFGSCRCDCGEQLHAAMRRVEKEGQGVIVYMNQEGRGIGLLNKLKAYKLQEQGYDTVEANLQLGLPMDARDYGVGAQILRDLGVSKIRLMSNNPKKRAGLIGYGLEIVENVPLEFKPNPHNLQYLLTKRDKLGHSILQR
ncbi:MAG: bifunctional 3,4-dihydroxy-2-butanone-4-phosphate synthase/GTP cyclohydrolase II [Bernardetiaceae bacterium]|jgi:3,4-dihydroxy 2-butanone 4-phosphate synthase/GTP cyclohydrolase II|nr:bifunctional 3,4-dihydroxy-2-butanone-4-phosphate synthase/GTP cyclohydrolase II [Bernardetiaceae bacterium]